MSTSTSLLACSHGACIALCDTVTGAGNSLSAACRQQDFDQKSSSRERVSKGEYLVF